MIFDEYTKFLAHCDGTGGSTSFPDATGFHTVTANGTAQVDTAQKVFGTGSALFDGNSDYLSIPHTDDVNFGSGNFTVETRIRFNSTSNPQVLMGHNGSSDRSWSWYYNSGNLRFSAYFNGTTNDIAFAWTPSINTWYHITVIRNGADLKMFVNGTQIGSTYNISTHAIRDSVSSAFWIAENIEDRGYYFNGWMDEIRISKGIARWTSNFTPPTAPYSGWEQVDIAETCEVSDSWLVATNPEQALIDESVEVSDAWFVGTNPQIADIAETVEMGDSWTIGVREQVNSATKIISVNPLIIVTDTNPAKIAQVDISVPASPTWIVSTLVGVNGAQDISLDTTKDFYYVACADGKVVKVDKTDLDVQTIIDISDTDDLMTIATMGNQGIVYTGTENAVGELYLLDERLSTIIDTEFYYLQQINTVVDTNFNYTLGEIIDTDFQYLNYENTVIDTDFKYLTDDFADLVPIARTDFQIDIDSTTLQDGDLSLNSITIRHNIGDDSQATFKLARNHDNVNETLSGSTVTITNNNIVEIYIQGNLEFSGQVSSLNCIYEKSTEYVIVTAVALQQTPSSHTTTLSLPGLDEDRSLYHIIIQGLNIDKYPILDVDAENPKYYKGIEVDLGQKIIQVPSRWRYVDDTAEVAEKVEDGSIQLQIGDTYFWFANAVQIKFPGVATANENVDKSDGFLPDSEFPTIEYPEYNFDVMGDFTDFLEGVGILKYIGTSLGSLTTDTWKLNRASYYFQRVKDDIVTELGVYQVGEAPFKTVTTSNGILIPKPKWVDKPDGLYTETASGYNYEEYAKTVAGLEYEKMQNINGDILPVTSANINVLLDAYYYYRLKLLTRINIDNTTKPNIYKNAQGFPVSIKSIDISSESMQVILTTDNQKSFVELEEIDDRYPDEDSDEFLFEATSVKEFSKFDPNQYKVIGNV